MNHNIIFDAQRRSVHELSVLGKETKLENVIFGYMRYCIACWDNAERKNYILDKNNINSNDETSIIVMEMIILGGPRPPQAAEKNGYFCVLGGNLASVPPLLITLLEQGGNTR